jgi:hypothetical protein
MSDPAQNPDAVVQRVDALLRRHQDPASVDPDVPVLTEVIDELPGRRKEVDEAALEALAAELERAVLERLSPEVERLIEEKLVNVLASVLGDSSGIRAELTRSVTQLVREAVAASVARALAPAPATLTPTPPPSEKK